MQVVMNLAELVLHPLVFWYSSNSCLASAVRAVCRYTTPPEVSHSTGWIELASMQQKLLGFLRLIHRHEDPCHADARFRIVRL
jgi:hypothetical protein